MRKSVHTQAYRALCVQLVAARRSANLTQVELASALDRPQSFVAKYERGERRIDIVELFEIAEILGADPQKIIRAVRAALNE
tara:strand:+ start:7069 stop:7314 length:246 start_codon:yes stop_codon:yes gene_type:complete